MPLGVEVGLGPGHIVLDGDPALPSPKVHSPQFLAHICCGQMAGWIKMPLGGEIGPSDIVLDGDPAPPRPKGAEPQFSSHVYCGQTARWIKMALGTEVGLGSAQRRCVRWETSSPSLKGARPSVFGPCLLWPNGYMDEDATWYGRRPQPRPHCVRRRPSSPLRKRNSTPPLSDHVCCDHSCTTHLLLSSCTNGRPYLLWPNGWMDQDATGWGDKSMRHSVRWGPSSASPKRGGAPIFIPCLLWPNG